MVDPGVLVRKLRLSVCSKVEGPTGPCFGARPMGKTSMKVGLVAFLLGRCLFGLRQDRRHRSHNYMTALPKTTFLLVIPEAFMLVKFDFTEGSLNP